MVARFETPIDTMPNPAFGGRRHATPPNGGHGPPYMKDAWVKGATHWLVFFHVGGVAAVLT